MMLKDALGAYRGGIHETTRVIGMRPDSADAWNDRANARNCLGNFSEAVSDYTRALELGLRFREALTALGNRGLARIVLGDLDGALDDFSEIILRKPTNKLLLRSAFVQRASVKEKKGDSEGAAADRNMAVMLSVR
jgi:tetratricopeptide (TPR) repeat protein